MRKYKQLNRDDRIKIEALYAELYLEEIKLI